MNSPGYSSGPERNTSDLMTSANQAIKRYWRLALPPALVLLGLIVAFNFHVKDYFTSDSLIFVQRQRIQSDIIKAPSEREMRTRLESTVQEILSRPRLRAIIEQYNLYPKLRGPRGLEAAVLRLRKKVEISPVRSPTGVDLLQTFRLAYTHGDPKTAYSVTQSIADLFIEESLIERRSEIQSTEEFIDAELRDARRQLELTEKKVQVFVSENFKQLPEHLNAAIARLESLQAQLTTSGQLVTANTVRRQNLESELAKATSQSLSISGSADTSSDPKEAINQLEAALVVLKSKYSNRHPDVIKTKRRIAALKDQLAGKDPGKSTALRESPLARSLRARISEVDIQLGALKDENKVLKESIAQLQNDIQTMPLKEQELLKIKRDYANVKAEYQRLLAAKGKAALQGNLVRSQKASQFRIIEPAELPPYPSGPNRKLILVGGVVASAVLFVVIIAALFFLNGAYKDRSGLEAGIGLPVLGIVPPMPTPDSAAYQRRLTSVSIIASLVSLVFGSAIIILVL